MIHIAKRKEMPLLQSMAIRGLSVVLALVICGVITTILTGLNPIDVYVTFFSGAFGSARKIWILLQEIAILLCVSLALAPAFKMKFWNLGGEGQVPNALLIACMVVYSIVAGAVWGLIPALFKAKWNTNETLFTLMMNYVAAQLVAYFIIVWEVPKGSGKIGIINQSTEAGWLPQIGDYKYLLNIILVAIITVLMYVYLKYTKHGYEISVVGESTNTARYVGIDVPKVIIRTMLLSRAICGFAGLLLVGGTDHTLATTIANSRGFTGVMVAWLAKFNPFSMIASSFLLVFMERGASEISTIYALNQSFADILTGIILFFIIGSEFFITYRVYFTKKSEEVEKADV